LARAIWWRVDTHGAAPRPAREGPATLSDHSTPGWYLGACLPGEQRPPLGSLPQGLRRTDHVAFVARGPATLLRRRGRQWVELGADGKTPDHVGHIGQRTALVLRGYLKTNA
jgi:hypothetical protein